MESCVVLHDQAFTALLGAGLCTLLGLGMERGPPEGWHSSRDPLVFALSGGDTGSHQHSGTQAFHPILLCTRGSWASMAWLPCHWMPSSVLGTLAFPLAVDEP